MRNKKVLFITQAAIIAALYVVLTVFIAAFNLASGSIQIRISEALCILPYFTPAAIPGLWIGCLIANLVTGASIFDIVFGSLATLLGAVFTYLLRRHKFLCTLPPVIANALIIPPVLIFAYNIPDVIWNGMNITWIFNVVTVGLGEVVSVCVLGTVLLNVLNKYRGVIFRESAEFSNCAASNE
jgi:uncharacterized membrane protein